MANVLSQGDTAVKFKRSYFYKQEKISRYESLLQRVYKLFPIPKQKNTKQQTLPKNWLGEMVAIVNQVDPNQLVDKQQLQNYCSILKKEKLFDLEGLLKEVYWLLKADNKRSVFIHAGLTEGIKQCPEGLYIRLQHIQQVLIFDPQNLQDILQAIRLALVYEAAQPHLFSSNLDDNQKAQNVHILGNFKRVAHQLKLGIPLTDDPYHDFTVRTTESSLITIFNQKYNLFFIIQETVKRIKEQLTRYGYQGRKENWYDKETKREREGYVLQEQQEIWKFLAKILALAPENINPDYFIRSGGGYAVFDINVPRIQCRIMELFIKEGLILTLQEKRTLLAAFDKLAPADKIEKILQDEVTLGEIDEQSAEAPRTRLLIEKSEIPLLKKLISENSRAEIVAAMGYFSKMLDAETFWAIFKDYFDKFASSAKTFLSPFKELTEAEQIQIIRNSHGYLIPKAQNIDGLVNFFQFIPEQYYAEFIRLYSDKIEQFVEKERDFRNLFQQLGKNEESRNALLDAIGKEKIQGLFNSFSKAEVLLNNFNDKTLIKSQLAKLLLPPLFKKLETAHLQRPFDEFINNFGLKIKKNKNIQSILAVFSVDELGIDLSLFEARYKEKNEAILCITQLWILLPPSPFRDRLADLFFGNPPNFDFFLDILQKILELHPLKAMLFITKVNKILPFIVDDYDKLVKVQAVLLDSPSWKIGKKIGYVGCFVTSLINATQGCIKTFEDFSSQLDWCQANDIQTKDIIIAMKNKKLNELVGDSNEKLVSFLKIKDIETCCKFIAKIDAGKLSLEAKNILIERLKTYKNGNLRQSILECLKNWVILPDEQINFIRMLGEHVQEVASLPWKHSPLFEFKEIMGLLPLNARSEFFTRVLKENPLVQTKEFINFLSKPSKLLELLTYLPPASTLEEFNQRDDLVLLKSRIQELNNKNLLNLSYLFNMARYDYREEKYKWVEAGVVYLLGEKAALFLSDSGSYHNYLFGNSSYITNHLPRGKTLDLLVKQVLGCFQHYHNMDAKLKLAQPVEKQYENIKKDIFILLSNMDDQSTRLAAIKSLGNFDKHMLINPKSVSFELVNIMWILNEKDRFEFLKTAFSKKALKVFFKGLSAERLKQVVQLLPASHQVPFLLHVNGGEKTLIKASRAKINKQLNSLSVNQRPAYIAAMVKQDKLLAKKLAELRREKARNYKNSAPAPARKPGLATAGEPEEVETIVGAPDPNASAKGLLTSGEIITMFENYLYPASFIARNYRFHKKEAHEIVKWYNENKVSCEEVNLKKGLIEQIKRSINGAKFNPLGEFAIALSQILTPDIGNEAMMPVPVDAPLVPVY